ncbi:tektin family protein [Ruminococcaceae bacterium OttesenSCG-928-I18]|nr:tektin family protein [Ruminococcaceae bacterium OttesenSCG-928-I18]
MADVIYTPDGKGHPMLGPDDFTQLIKDYAGRDAAQYVARLQEEVNDLQEEVEGLEEKLSCLIENWPDE